MDGASVITRDAGCRAVVTTGEFSGFPSPFLSGRQSRFTHSLGTQSYPPLDFELFGVTSTKTAPWTPSKGQTSLFAGR